MAIFEGPFQDIDGKRILQVHSRGYKETISDRTVPIFSPFGVRVTYGSTTTSLEDLFQRVRVFADERGALQRPADWRQARAWLKAGRLQVGWHFGLGGRHAVQLVEKAGPKPDALTLSDPGLRFYVALWADFLRTPEGQRRLAIARGFDDFCDPFEGVFPFGQAALWRMATRTGVDALDTIAGTVRDRMLPVSYLDELRTEDANVPDLTQKDP